MTDGRERLPSLRVSDADREAAVSRLRGAAGEGRLTFEELADRTELAYAARTEDDLAVISEDLPASVVAPRAEVDLPADERTDWVVAIMGGEDRKGRWRMRRRTRVMALMGGATLDLREAELPEGDVQVTIWAVMGGAEVLVPEGIRVEMGGLALMGGNSSKGNAGAPPAGAPTVWVRAYSVMGGVEVKRKRLRERPAPRRLPH